MMHEIGARPTKLDADLRRILSCASRDIWIDEFGRRYHPLTRDEILDGLKSLSAARDNFAKLMVLMRDLSSGKSQRPV
jgi:hypothetical protein